MNTIITGASRGIGRAIAEAFAAEGHQLLLCSRNEAALNQTIAEIAALYPKATIHGFAADMADEKQVNNFADWCLSFGQPGILVNNAGQYVPGDVLSANGDALQKMIVVNLYSAWWLVRTIAPAMKQKRSGHIFNISSIAGMQAYENGGAYSISKYALNGLSDNLRHELKPYGVKVTNVLPGAVMTDSWAGFDNSDRRIMEASDIAKMIVAASKLSPQAVVENMVLRPQLGDL